MVSRVEVERERRDSRFDVACMSCAVEMKLIHACIAALSNIWHHIDTELPAQKTTQSRATAQHWVLYYYTNDRAVIPSLVPERRRQCQ